MPKPCLHNPAAERAVLSGICCHNVDAFIDVDPIVEIESFVTEEHQIIFKCLSKVLQNSNSLDMSSILSAANDLGFYENFQEEKILENLREIYNTPVELEKLERKDPLKRFSEKIAV